MVELISAFGLILGVPTPCPNERVERGTCPVESVGQNADSKVAARDVSREAAAGTLSRPGRDRVDGRVV
jgi:hypothetical protein